jgi:hypothetical protein
MPPNPVRSITSAGRATNQRPPDVAAAWASVSTAPLGSSFRPALLTRRDTGATSRVAAT